MMYCTWGIQDDVGIWCEDVTFDELIQLMYATWKVNKVCEETVVMVTLYVAYEGVAILTVRESEERILYHICQQRCLIVSIRCKNKTFSPFPMCR